MSRTIVRFLVSGLALAGLGALMAGCSNAPSADDLKESILAAAENDPSVTVTDTEASCMATIIMNADLSETTLTGLAENFDQPTVLASEQDKIEPLVTTAAIECSE